jgi:hypothetical protein
MDIQSGNSLVDGMFAGGLLLFTGTEVAFESSVLEVISKVGVIAVLWFWLRDLKAQMKAQLTTFDKETNEIRDHYDKIIEDKNKEFHEYRERMAQQLREKDAYISELHNKMLDKISSDNK